jgi:hypothetical protein
MPSAYELGTPRSTSDRVALPQQASTSSRRNYINRYVCSARSVAPSPGTGNHSTSLEDRHVRSNLRDRCPDYAGLCRTGTAGSHRHVAHLTSTLRTCSPGACRLAGAVRSTPMGQRSRNASEAIPRREFGPRDPARPNHHRWCMPRSRLRGLGTTRGGGGRVRAEGAFPACGAGVRPDDRRTAAPLRAANRIRDLRELCGYGSSEATYAVIAIRSSSVSFSTAARIIFAPSPFRVPCCMSYICRAR